MSARKPRWEIVRTDAGWHARYVTSNGKTIVSSEVYTRRENAVRAMWIVRDDAIAHYESRRDVEVRDIDERATP